MKKSSKTSKLVLAVAVVLLVFVLVGVSTGQPEVLFGKVGKQKTTVTNKAKLAVESVSMAKEKPVNFTGNYIASLYYNERLTPITLALYQTVDRGDQIYKIAGVALFDGLTPGLVIGVYDLNKEFLYLSIEYKDKNYIDSFSAERQDAYIMDKAVVNDYNVISFKGNYKRVSKASSNVVIFEKEVTFADLLRGATVAKNLSEKGIATYLSTVFDETGVAKVQAVAVALLALDGEAITTVWDKILTMDGSDIINSLNSYLNSEPVKRNFNLVNQSWLNINVKGAIDDLKSLFESYQDSVPVKGETPVQNILFEFLKPYDTRMVNLSGNYVGTTDVKDVLTFELWQNFEGNVSGKTVYGSIINDDFRKANIKFEVKDNGQPDNIATNLPLKVEAEYIPLVNLGVKAYVTPGNENVEDRDPAPSQKISFRIEGIVLSELGQVKTMSGTYDMVECSVWNAYSNVCNEYDNTKIQRGHKFTVSNVKNIANEKIVSELAEYDYSEKKDAINVSANGIYEGLLENNTKLRFDLFHEMPEEVDINQLHRVVGFTSMDEIQDHDYLDRVEGVVVGTFDANKLINYGSTDVCTYGSKSEDVSSIMNLKAAYFTSELPKELLIKYLLSGEESFNTDDLNIENGYFIYNYNFPCINVSPFTYITDGVASMWGEFSTDRRSNKGEVMVTSLYNVVDVLKQIDVNWKQVVDDWINFVQFPEHI